MDDSFPWLARLLQVNDSSFPTGGYAHSYGFEQIVQFGLVHDDASMSAHLENHLWPMLVHFELPVVRLAREAARNDNLPALIELTEIVDASKSARELREASRVTGARRLHAFCATDPSPILSRFFQAVEEGRAIPHHAIVYAIGEKDVPLSALLAAWSFQSITALCLAAPKLFRIGQDAAQRILTAALAETDIRITQSLDISREDLGYFDPLLDLASMHHEIAHERLFIS